MTSASLGGHRPDYPCIQKFHDFPGKKEKKLTSL